MLRIVSDVLYTDIDHVFIPNGGSSSQSGAALLAGEKPRSESFSFSWNMLTET